MNSRHLLSFGFLMMALGWAGGCAVWPFSMHPAAAPVVEQPATQPVDAHVTVVDALTRKTSAYAQGVEAALAKGPASPAASTPVMWTTPATPPATAPAIVQWIEPDPIRLTALPATYHQVTAAPLIKPTVEAIAPAAVPKQEPAQAIKPAALPPPVDVLEERFAQRLKDYPRDVAGHLDYQLLQFVRNQQVPQMSAIASLPAEDRELITALLDGLSNFRNSVRADNSMLLSRKIRPILELADRLRSQAELCVPTASLCTRVDGFGVYQPIDPARFPAGRAIPVILYCEIENFRSELNDKRQWETRLTEQIVLYTEAGLQVWPAKPQPVAITDMSRNRRHDFFLVKQINLPANLTIGRYLLKITIVDQQAARVAEATLPIQIVAQ